jgi:hypothetical protein
MGHTQEESNGVSYRTDRSGIKSKAIGGMRRIVKR